MKTPLPEIVPLEDDEREWLLHLYSSGLRRLGGNFLMACFFLLLFTFSRVGFLLCAIINDVFLGARETALVSEDFLSMWETKLFIVVLLAVLVCFFSYLSLQAYKMDAKSGVKQRTSCTVARKAYNSVSDECFVWINGNIDKSYVIAADKYNSCEEGGEILMDQAIKSKYIFG